MEDDLFIIKKKHIRPRQDSNTAASGHKDTPLPLDHKKQLDFICFDVKQSNGVRVDAGAFFDFCDEVFECLGIDILRDADISQHYMC